MIKYVLGTLGAIAATFTITPNEQERTFILSIVVAAFVVKFIWYIETKDDDPPKDRMEELLISSKRISFWFGFASGLMLCTFFVWINFSLFIRLLQ